MAEAVEIMTAYEVAALLRLHLRTVYKLAEKGVIPGNKVGRGWRFDRRDILGLIADRKRLRLEPEKQIPRKRSRN